MSKKPDTVYLIFDTKDQILWSSGTKIGWVSPGAAKNAWNLAEKGPDYRNRPRFGDQNRYIIVAIHAEDVSKIVKSIQEGENNEHE